MEPAIHRESVPVSQMLFLFHNRTGIYDWATNLQRREADQKRLQRRSARRASPGGSPELLGCGPSTWLYFLSQLSHLVGALRGLLDFRGTLTRSLTFTINPMVTFLQIIQHPPY